MNDPVIVHVEAKIPATLLKEFLQHIRSFDARYTDFVAIGMSVLCPTLPAKEVEAICKSLDPPFPYIDVRSLL